MLTIRDHFSDASQNNAEIQIDLNTAMGGKLLESAQKIANLNSTAARTSLRAAEKMLRKGLRARNSQELAAMATMQAQASSRNAASYACNVAGIAAGTQSELIGLLGVQITETSTEVAELVADVSRNASGGYGHFIPAMRLGFDHANAGCEQVAQATRQVLDTLETSFIAAARQFDKAARHSASAA